MDVDSMFANEVDLLKDVYYSKEYCSLYLKEGEELFEFRYKDGDYEFYNLAIKRPILKIGVVEIEDGCFDLETAYGYGGFYVNTDNQDFISEAMIAYEKKCIEENIIAEFVRFHPFNAFPLICSQHFDMNVHDRNVAVVDLSLSQEHRWKGYSKNTRNILRKCQKELVFRQTNNLDRFIELYEQTMDKNSASEFYYFSIDYYLRLMENQQIELYEVLKDGRVVSTAFFMFDGSSGHYHLSANDYGSRGLNANYLILDEIFEIAKGRNIKFFILGGGTTSDVNDSLIRFKQKFSTLTRPFYISGKIYNKAIYNRYIFLWESQAKKRVNFFLKYRLKIE